MHVVVWTAEGERYAVATSIIVEVIPMVEPRRLDLAPDWLVGLINYRGTLIPLLDLRSLLGRGNSALRRASRILVTRLGADDTSGDPVGLLVESLESVGRYEFEGDGARPALRNPDTPFLGPVALTAEGTVQLILPDALLRDEHRAMLADRTTEAQP